MIVFLEYILKTPNFHKGLFKKYNPDLLIVSSIGTLLYDELIMREAKKNKTKVLSIILSWDNTSSKGMSGAFFDHVIAWTDVMKHELVSLNDVPSDKVSVCGIAHFDYYYKSDFLYKKEEFYKKYGISQKSKVIFFGTKSPSGYPWNGEIAEMILNAIEQEYINSGCTLVVRLHPIYYKKKNGKYIHQFFLDEFERLQFKYQNLIIDRPEMISDSINYGMPSMEIKKLASSLKYFDVLVNIFSTLNLEASIFDLPIVNICFEGNKYKGSMKARYDISMDERQNHNLRIIESGGISMVYNEREMIKSINSYLENPSLNSEGRRKIFEQETGPFHGNASNKIADKILELI